MALASTTNSVAIGSSDLIVTLASTTALTSIGMGIFVDGELLATTALPFSNGTVAVRRGQSGSMQTAHAVSQTAYIGTRNQFYTQDPQGKPPAVPLVTPWINVVNNTVWAVSGGAWVETGGSSGAAPGSNTQVLFNDSGALGADSGLTYVKGTDTLTAGNLTLPNDGSLLNVPMYTPIGNATLLLGAGTSEGAAVTIFPTGSDTNLELKGGDGGGTAILRGGASGGTAAVRGGYHATGDGGSTVIAGGTSDGATGVGGAIDIHGGYSTLAAGGAITIVGGINLATGAHASVSISDVALITTTITTAETLLLQAYDVDGAAYKTFATLTNANTPTFVVTPPSGGTITVNATTLQQGGSTITLGGALTLSGAFGTTLTVTGTTGVTLPTSGTLATLAGAETLSSKSITLGNAGVVQTDTTTAHTGLIQAYDVDGTAYKTFATLTNGNTPDFTIAPPSGGTVTVQASTFKSSDGTSGVSAGPFTTITAITVKNGLVVALTGA